MRTPAVFAALVHDEAAAPLFLMPSSGNLFQILDKENKQPIVACTIARAKDTGWVKGQEEARSEGAGKKLAVLMHHGYLSTD